jgi:hypothetical protein
VKWNSENGLGEPKFACFINKFHTVHMDQLLGKGNSPVDEM